jgi:hypothetical protein
VGCSHLRADELPPGDVIKADGLCLTVEAVLPTPNLVIVDFIDLPHYGLTTLCDREVRVLAQVGVAL